MGKNISDKTLPGNTANLKWKKWKIVRPSIQQVVLIITTVIAIIGFVRDLRSMYASPGFKHIGVFNLFRTIPYKGKTYTSFLINGPIYNTGEKPLFPMYYSLEIKGQDSTLFIPASAVTKEYLDYIADERVNNMEGIIDKDLRKVTRLNPDDAIWGPLLFFVEGYVEGDFIPDEVKYRIVVTDINDVEYKTEYRHINDGVDLKFFDEPKLNLIIRDTTKHPFDR